MALHLWFEIEVYWRYGSVLRRVILNEEHLTLEMFDLPDMGRLH